MGASSLIVLIFAAIAFSAGGMAVAKIFVKGSRNPQKGQTYESGIPSKGSPWNQFNVGYYLFALIFLIFDVELIFMYPWAVVYREAVAQSHVIFWSMLSFVSILMVGYVYALKKGALDWKK